MLAKIIDQCEIGWNYAAIITVKGVCVKASTVLAIHPP